MPTEVISKTGEKYLKQQIVAQRPNGKYPFSLCLAVYRDDVNAFKPGDIIKAYLSNDIHVTQNGNLINNISGRKIVKIYCAMKTENKKAGQEPKKIDPTEEKQWGGFEYGPEVITKVVEHSTDIEPTQNTNQ